VYRSSPKFALYESKSCRIASAICCVLDGRYILLREIVAAPPSIATVTSAAFLKGARLILSSNDWYDDTFSGDDWV